MNQKPENSRKTEETKSKAIGVFIGLGLDFYGFDWCKETEINDYEVL